MTKIPSDVRPEYLRNQLRRHFGYEVDHGKGSHQVLTTNRDGEKHVTVPDGSPIPVGTLRSILKKLEAHHHLSVQELIRLLKLLID